MLTALLLILAQNQEPNAENWIRPPRAERVQRAGGRSGPGFAFFEAFPSSGAGTKGVCSTTAPTGAKGETLTFTRASNGTCTRTATGGLATTGIANGDLVVLSSNQPRVSYDANGTLGLLVESSRTNSLLRSEEFDNAAWTKGPSIGTITADYATAPDGTLTADRYQYSNTNNDYVLQAFPASTLAASTSVYLKGTSGSGTINMCRGGAGSQCVTCSYVSTSWSRCRYEATLALSNNVFLGCENATLGGACAQTGFDVLVWGLQGEVGAYATSYIPTVAATVTRAADGALTTPSLSGLSNPFCIGATVTGISSLSLSFAERGLVEYASAWRLDAANNQGRVTRAGVGAVSSGTATAPSITSSVRYSFNREPNGSDVVVCTNSSCSAATVLTGTTPASGTVAIGVTSASQPYVEGIISRVVLDLSGTRCR